MNTDWQHPEHVHGIKTPRIFDTIVGKPLTDRRIDHYIANGFYSNRRSYQRELRKVRAVQEVLRPKGEKRLVYNIEKQEFEEREF